MKQKIGNKEKLKLTGKAVNFDLKFVVNDDYFTESLHKGLYLKQCHSSLNLKKKKNKIMRSQGKRKAMSWSMFFSEADSIMVSRRCFDACKDKKRICQ